MFSKLKKAAHAAEVSEETSLNTLSEQDIEGVSGGAGCWMEMMFVGGVRWVWHSGYPAEV